MEKFEPLKLGIQQVAEVTGESLHVIHNAINEGHLSTFLVGRRRFAKPAAVRAWIDYLEAESNAGRPVNYRSREKEAERKEAFLARNAQAAHKAVA